MSLFSSSALLLLASGGIGLAVVLWYAWVRVCFWKGRADHWFNRAMELDREMLKLRWDSFVSERGIEWPRRIVTPSPSSPGSIEEFTGPRIVEDPE